MPVDKVNVWNDPRVQKRSAHLNGRTYGYLYCEPQEGYRGTIFLIHGFPDISMGWRYQIPMLLSLGLRVVAPDCMGYGRTDAPPYKLRDYSLKRISDDMAELARQLGTDRIILGGHDWGGAVVFRIALYHPQLIKALFSICTPYIPPSQTYTPLLLLTRTVIPNFTYQLHLASGEIEERIQSPAEIRAFLNAGYGGLPAPASADGHGPPPRAPPIWDPEKGINLDLLADAHSYARTPLFSDEELDYYVQEFSRSATSSGGGGGGVLHAPLNWYRTREVNWEDEWTHFFRFGEVSEAPRLGHDVLFVLASKDAALKPELAKHMVEAGAGEQGEGKEGKKEDAKGTRGLLLPNLRRREVDTGHWALWERPEEVNEHVKAWLEEVVFKDENAGAGSKL